MARTRQGVFTTVRSEGALLPPDFLKEVAEGRDDIPGLTPGTYHLTGHERLNEAASRSWNRLVGVWAAFQAASNDLKKTDPATGVTRERWLLPLFQELGYGRLLTAKTFEVGGKSYPISHLWQHTPIHLVGRNVDLDRRFPGVVGAAKTSPHGLLQDFLNRSEHHLWGFLSNGLQLRILRDNKSLTRQAYVEFDLAAMMEGQVYADFVLLWLFCHQSRVQAERPEQCWLERWSDVARQQGTRALDQLRDGVERAIEALGRGFLAHGANGSLHEKLRSGASGKQDYYRQLLRTVYRLIFLFVAEDRDLLLTAKSGVCEREHYIRYYSMARLRTLAERRRGSPHGDLWRGLSLVFRKLSSDTGSPELGLPALGSFLWSAEAASDLAQCELANADLLDAIRALAFTVDAGIRRTIDYKNLGPEELGSVYESLLELHPEVNADAPTFSLTTAAGHERKTTGSYYTPTGLIECLLESALDPVLEEAAKQADPEKAILNLKVCDPACGSGHFLIAAGHRIATYLAAVRTGDEEPSPEAVRTALRDVVGRCLYGVDVNPMAVELCKVNLWLEALDPGKPLSFLEHHIQCGNSLLGSTPALLRQGIPDDAFEPLEGDDKECCKKYKKENKKERKGFLSLFQPIHEPWERLGVLATALVDLDAIPDSTVDGQKAKQQRWEQLIRSTGYESGRLWADAWCAAFVWKKANDQASPYPITEEIFRKIEENPFSVPDWMPQEIGRLAEKYRFFHWHLSFPDVFRVPVGGEEVPKDGPGWFGGFDLVLGNPPWERIKLQEKEFFAEHRPDIANAPNAAARTRMIKALEKEDLPLFRAFQDALRRADGESALVRRSGRYPLCGRGDINTYAIFAELNRLLISSKGRVGCIVPSGIATDDTTKYFFQDLVEKRSLVSLFDFENRMGIFPGVHRSYKFCLLTLAGGASRVKSSEFVFFAQETTDLGDPIRRFTLAPEDFALLNPNTRTCPIFRSRRDAELTRAIYCRVPVLIREAQGNQPDQNPWGIRFRTMFHMANDSHLFRTREQLEAEGWWLDGNIFHKEEAEYLPLYEAKMFHQFNHRWSHANEAESGGPMVTNPAAVALPRYWVRREEVRDNRPSGSVYDWYPAYRCVARSTDERTFISTVVPMAGFGHSSSVMLFENTTATSIACLPTVFTSLVLDYCARQKLGGANMTLGTTQQLPMIRPAVLTGATPWDDRASSLCEWLLPHILELTYTAWDLEPFAQDCGWFGPPFRWDEERRFLLRCELDAAFFHLYLPSTPNGEWRVARKADGCPYDETPEQLAELKRHFPTPRDAVDYIMDTFPIVKRKDEARFDGDYRTKRVILETYDAMQECIRTSRPYQTRLDPPPADPRCCHPPRQ